MLFETAAACVLSASSCRRAPSPDAVATRLASTSPGGRGEFVRRVVLLAVIALVASSAAFASSVPSRLGVIKLDPSKTLVEFRLGGSLHSCHGKFQLKTGMIKADSASGKAEGMIVVDAASGDSGDSIRDHRMKDSVLEAEKFPEITFSARHIEGHLDRGGGFQVKLEGVLKLHGAEHKIVIDARGTLIDDNLVATAHFSVPYVEWGLKDPSVLFLTVAKQVDIDIATTGRVTWPAGDLGRIPVYGTGIGERTLRTH
jgi:polyisoprenoid-binding protein YceI